MSTPINTDSETVDTLEDRALRGTAILEMRDIDKVFPGVRALDHVNLVVARGEIHALVGENGAGKSTLMKVLSGVYPYGTYDGEIIFNGEVCRFRSIAQSEACGIVIIHQEFALIPGLSIAENLFLGNERQRRGVINWGRCYAEALSIMKKVGLHESPDTRVGTLGVGKQQLVEIAKALAKQVRLLILDEPTSSLSETDSRALLALLLQLKQDGISSVLISHKLNEVSAVADSITILRDGSAVETLDCREQAVTEERVIRGMVGRDLNHRFPSRSVPIGATMFEVQNWSVDHPTQIGRTMVSDVSIYARAGEVVGIAGLMGSGRTELAMSVFGRSYGRNFRGRVLVRDNVADVSNVQRAIAAGIAYVTEDRKTLGLILSEDIKTNITLANLAGVSSGPVISKAKEVMVGNEFRNSLSIKSSSVEQTTINLSGGNQQKVVLGKWLFAEPDVLILDEPTRGIDVGAKYEIYSIINDLAARGKAVVLISSELPEVLGVCDRIYVMSEGQIAGELQAAHATQETIMQTILRHNRELETAFSESNEIAEESKND